MCWSVYICRSPHVTSLLACSSTVTDQPISLAEWWCGLACFKLQEDIAERGCLFF